MLSPGVYIYIYWLLLAIIAFRSHGIEACYPAVLRTTWVRLPTLIGESSR